MSVSPELWTVRRVLGWTAQHFDRRALDSPRLTAELLLAHALGTTRVRLYTELDRPLNPPELAAYRALVERRSRGEPTHYLTGSREFYGRRFSVDPGVLIPRPETELLVEAVLRALPKGDARRVLDLCTGSGCIAVTIACERVTTHVVAVDLSPDACRVTRRNVEAHGVQERVSVREGDLFSFPALPGDERFDALVCNAPYVPTEELGRLSPEVQREPRLALDGGPDGLQVIRRVVSGAAAHLRPGGLIALELAEDQGPRVEGLLLEAGFEAVRIEQDLARLNRLALGTQPAA